MNKLLLILLPILAAFLLSTDKKKKQQPPTKAEIQQILDSFKVIRKLNALAEGYRNPPTAEELRYNNITMMLFRLPLSEARKLMADPNPVARVYGIAIGCKKYFNELTSGDLKILDDTAKFSVLTQNGIIEAPFTVGEFAKMMYESMPAEIEMNRKENIASDSLDAFIKKYAAHPASYNFTDYIVTGDKNPYTEKEFFQFKYTYSLNDKYNVPVSDTTYFILNETYKVIRITQDSIIDFSWFEAGPDYGTWLEKFGRKLNHNDSLDLSILSTR